MNENTKYWCKFFLYITSYFWVRYLAIFFHELGHAISVISLGGTFHEIVVSWMGGKVLWSWENVPPSSLHCVTTLVLVSGGIGGALFFMMLSHKSKWFTVPAIYSLLFGYGEAMHLGDLKYNATGVIEVSVLIICIYLFLQFEWRQGNLKLPFTKGTRTYYNRGLKNEISRRNSR